MRGHQPIQLLYVFVYATVFVILCIFIHFCQGAAQSSTYHITDAVFLHYVAFCWRFEEKNFINTKIFRETRARENLDQLTLGWTLCGHFVDFSLDNLSASEQPAAKIRAGPQRLGKSCSNTSIPILLNFENLGVLHIKAVEVMVMVLVVVVVVLLLMMMLIVMLVVSK